MKRFELAVRQISLSVGIAICIALLASCADDRIPQPLVQKSMPGETADSIILAQLCQKKIVMVGDGAHSHRYFYQLVLRVLRGWLESVVKNATHQQRDSLTEIHWTHHENSRTRMNGQHGGSRASGISVLRR